MHKLIGLIRRPAAALTLLATTVPAFAVDIANLPTLQNGDISISNDAFPNFVGTAKPDICQGVWVKLDMGATTAVRCSGATKVKVWFRLLDAAGQGRDITQELDVNNHYVFGWDDELKAYVKLIKLFDNAGRVAR